MFRKTPWRNLVKSFIKIHFPMIISIIVLLLMISTFIGAAHFEHGVLSIEPNSRNLIIYADNSPRDSAISVRGPYTVDAAIENESNEIRMPADAMMTLGIKVNDTIQFDEDAVYVINETRPGESDILRLPIEVKKILDVDNGEVIQNSRLKDIFEGALMVHSQENDNTTIVEKFLITSRDKHSSTFEVLLDNNSLINSSGIFKNNVSYGVSVNGDTIGSFNYKTNLTKTFNYDGHKVKIAFTDTNSTSIKLFTRENQDNFLNIQF